MNALEKEVLQYIGENTVSPDVFSDITPIRDSINDAIEEISLLTGSYQERYIIPLYEGQGVYMLEFSRGEYAYPTNVFIRGDNYSLCQTDLIKLNMTNPNWMKDNSRPTEYALIGTKYLLVYPAPSATGSILEIDCVVIPERYENDNGRIKLRENFKKSVIHYAVSEYYATRGDAKSAANHLAQFMKLSGLDQMAELSKETPYRLDRESQRTANSYTPISSRS